MLFEKMWSEPFTAVKLQTLCRSGAVTGATSRGRCSLVFNQKASDLLTFLRNFLLIFSVVCRRTWTTTCRTTPRRSTASPVSTRARRTWPSPAPRRSAPSASRWSKRWRWGRARIVYGASLLLNQNYSKKAMGGNRWFVFWTLIAKYTACCLFLKQI